MNNAKYSLSLNGVAWQVSPLTVIYISLFISSLLSLPATKTPGMTFRHFEKLKTCDWEEKCLKYMNQNMRSDSWVQKPVNFITLTRSNFNMNLHYSFQEWIIETKNEINIHE